MYLLTPGIGLIFWQGVIFLLLLFVLTKYAWKPITDSLKEREKFIEDSLDSAKKAEEELVNIQKKNEDLLSEARKEREKILSWIRVNKDRINKANLSYDKEPTKGKWFFGFSR